MYKELKGKLVKAVSGFKKVPENVSSPNFTTTNANLLDKILSADANPEESSIDAYHLYKDQLKRDDLVALRDYGVNNRKLFVVVEFVSAELAIQAGKDFGGKKSNKVTQSP